MNRLLDYAGLRPVRMAVLLVVVVLFVNSGGLSGADRFVGSLVAVNVVAALGLTVVYGWTGLLSIGQAALMGASAYGFTIASVRGVPFWWAVLLGIAIAIAGGVLLGLVAARVRSHYFILATLAIAEILTLFLNNQISLTGGDNGLSGVPSLTIFGTAVTSDRNLLTLTSAVAVVAIFVCGSLKSAKLGIGMRTLNANNVLGLASGISPRSTRLAASSIAGGFAGVAGILYALTATYLGPSDFNLGAGIVLLVGVVLGGLDSVGGAVVGTVFVSYLAFGVPGLNTKGPLIYGVGVVVILMVTPNGLAGGVRYLLRRYPIRVGSCARDASVSGEARAVSSQS
jgi:branched-chain amino acid transport system permease protein